MVPSPPPGDFAPSATSQQTRSAPTAHVPDPRAWYEERVRGAAAEEERLEARLRRLATFRLLAFLGTAAPLLALETSPRGWWPALFAVAGVLLVVFVVLVVRHRRIRLERDRTRIRRQVAEEGPARMDRRWDALPLLELDPAPANHPSAGDLDVLGRASMAHLLGTPRTLPGRAALRSVLLDPHGDGLPHADQASRRTDRRLAMDALSRHPELLESVQVAARSVRRKGDPAALEAFRAWAQEPGWLDATTRGRWLLAARFMTAVNLTLFVGWFAGWAPFWIGGAALSLLLWSRVRVEAHARFDAVEGAEASLGQWAGLLEVAADLPADAPLLERIRQGASSPVEGARALASLRRISDWAQVRRSSLVYFPVALLTAWDIHPLVPMERWRDRYGDQVDRWLEAVGELELLVALAVLRFDHPAWCLPGELPLPGAGPAKGAALGSAPDAGVGPALRASDLRHPLLPPDRAVGNDVELPAPGSLLLVTGSNMSGKSTLLRAIGANQLLLLAGGPVAASRFEAPPLTPWSSMRIRDSLVDGVSLFMAELQRLKRVVDAARGEPVLVLLDEILQGTNTAERRMAARTILTHLMEAKAVGAVSTHDLTLADAPELAAHLTQVHLKEEVKEVEGRRTLSFDHRLRPGPATSKNALLLLELVGLGAEPEEAPVRVEPQPELAPERPDAQNGPP
ncbi:MutS family DNA mismatch repair protein [soil metagenome]